LLTHRSAVHGADLHAHVIIGTRNAGGTAPPQLVLGFGDTGSAVEAGITAVTDLLRGT
jgi:hypothetical protein